MWEEVQTASQEKRYELVLHGREISERIAENGLDLAIFTLINLNFLQISQTGLIELPAEIGSLVNLRTLDLHQNQLSVLPSTVGKLTDLKFLDLSHNNLVELPSEFTHLTNLHTLNVSCNQIVSLPSFIKLQNLCKFDCSHNQLEDFPNGIHQLQALYELRAKGNKICTLSGEISSNISLKILDLSANQLKTVPQELGQCQKLKELLLLNNPITDNRLKKLIAQCSTKAVLDYVRNAGGKTKSKGKKGKKHISQNDEEENVNDKFVISVERSEDFKIVVKENVADVRPFIVCVIAKQIDLGEPEMFKNFISLQTKLHETVCENRAVGTIATHNFTGISFPLTYEALPLDEISLVPLGKEKIFTATELIRQLKEDAMKEKQRTKRQAKSGLLKYLSLIENAESLACLKSSDGTVISLPPITNSNESKISQTCLDIVLEVTSDQDLNVCKRIMDELIEKIIESGLYSSVNKTDKKELRLVQVRISDERGTLKVVYPSRNDLSLQMAVVQFTDK